MKTNVFLIITTLFLANVVSAQTASKNEGKLDKCEEIKQQIKRSEQQISSLEKREAFLNSKETVNQKDLDNLSEKKAYTLKRHAELLQIREQSCNPNSKNNTSEIQRIESKKQQIKKEDFNNLSKERQQQILNSPNQFEIIE